MGGTIVLAGCVKTQHMDARQARDLYCSQLWRERRAYAERSRLPWLVLSAGHGLIDPLEVIAPYDARPDALDWYTRCVSMALTLERAGFVMVEIHAGARYAVPLALELERIGLIPVLPLEGLQIGEQIAQYSAWRVGHALYGTGYWVALGRSGVQA